MARKIIVLRPFGEVVAEEMADGASAVAAGGWRAALQEGAAVRAMARACLSAGPPPAPADDPREDSLEEAVRRAGEEEELEPGADDLEAA
eukprot:6948449-Prorocentrum_lima.AAC.1